MDGLLILDKPSGPTSHDVVARMRATLGEKRIGHAGTLDPIASGLLLLTVGRATRLTRFLSGADKGYDATIRLGMQTSTYDRAGVPVGDVYDGPLPDLDAIDRALDTFRGTFLQQPPAYSAKKIGGRRSHRIARQSARSSSAAPAGDRVLPAPARVTVHTLTISKVAEDTVNVRTECSAGFYVRSLAHDLGQRLGTGAHLVSLRRFRSGDLTLADAVPLASVEQDRDAAARALVPLADMLHTLTPLHLTADGVRRVGHGCDLCLSDFSLDPAHSVVADSRTAAAGRWYRLLDPSGQLVGVAEPAGSGLLHPSIVLV
jgi:tRNA pseudouridine55 synthase